jgi:hypothetical protein
MTQTEGLAACVVSPAVPAFARVELYMRAPLALLIVDVENVTSAMSINAVGTELLLSPRPIVALAIAAPPAV